MHNNLHTGKIGILVNAPEEGLGVTNHELREKVLPEIEKWRKLT